MSNYINRYLDSIPLGYTIAQTQATIVSNLLACGWAPATLGLYLKGQNSSNTAIGRCRWIEKRAYGDGSAPYRL